MGQIQMSNIRPAKQPVLTSAKHLILKLPFKFYTNKSYRNSIKNDILKLFTTGMCTWENTTTSK